MMILGDVAWAGEGDLCLMIIIGAEGLLSAKEGLKGKGKGDVTF